MTPEVFTVRASEVAVIDTITSDGIVTASCATDLKTTVWLSRMDGISMTDV